MYDCIMMSSYCFLQGFLVESKLNKLLQPLEKDERSLMKLDAIFTVSLSLSPSLPLCLS